MRKGLLVWLVCLVPAAGSCAAVDPQLLLILRGMMAREGRIVSVRGYLLQHQMRSADNVVRERAWIEKDAPRDANLRTTFAPISEDGVWAVSFAADDGRCRFETVVYKPSFDDWNASIRVLPFEAGRAARTILTEDGTKRTEYNSTHQSALVVAQSESPSVVQRQPLARALMLSPARGYPWSRMLAWRMALAGQEVANVPESYRVVTPEQRAGFRDLKPLPGIRVEDQECVGYAATQANKAGGLGTSRVWCSEKLGYAVVRVDSSEPLAGRPGFTRTQRMIAKDWVQVGEGIWLPRFTTESMCDVDGAGKRSNLVTTISRFRELDCSKLDDDTFRAHLPLGTYVQDTVGTAPYVVGEATDRDADRVARADREQWDSQLNWLMGEVPAQP